MFSNLHRRSHALTYAHTHTCIHKGVRARTHTYRHIGMYTHAQTHAYMHTGVHTQIHRYAHRYAHTHTNTHTDAHRHALVNCERYRKKSVPAHVKTGKAMLEMSLLLLAFPQNPVTNQATINLALETRAKICGPAFPVPSQRASGTDTRYENHFTLPILVVLREAVGGILLLQAQNVKWDLSCKQWIS